MATPMQASRLAVTVVCLAGGRNFLKEMIVPKGQTLGWCVNASGVYGLWPELRGGKIGVFGRVMAAETLVESGDRVEVYVAASKDAADKVRKAKRGAVA